MCLSQTNHDAGKSVTAGDPLPPAVQMKLLQAELTFAAAQDLQRQLDAARCELEEARAYIRKLESARVVDS